MKLPNLKKHKIYLYKEDFQGFKEILEEMTNYIINEKGEEVISEIHQKDYNSTTTALGSDLNFEDI